MKIKICGIRRIEDIEFINEYKPDYIGFVFARSKRQVSLETALNLAKKTDRSIKKVGVFVNQPIELLTDALLCGAVDYLQLHGDEDLEYEKALCELLKSRGISKPEGRLIRAYRIRDERDFENIKNTLSEYLLLDAFSEKCEGGNGESFDWSIIKNVEKPYFLAGGISTENVQRAINEVQPFAVDVSSSLETDGFKDREKIKRFMNACR